MFLITAVSGRIGRHAAEPVLGKLDHRAGALRLMTRTPEQPRGFEGADNVSGNFSRSGALAPAFRSIDVALIISGSAPPGAQPGTTTIATNRVTT